MDFVEPTVPSNLCATCTRWMPGRKIMKCAFTRTGAQERCDFYTTSATFEPDRKKKLTGILSGAKKLLSEDYPGKSYGAIYFKPTGEEPEGSVAQIARSIANEVMARHLSEEHNY
jgi:hypothetical protein